MSILSSLLIFIKNDFRFQEGQRNSEKSQRSQLDLCVVLFRTRNPANPTSVEVGRLVEHSKRQVSNLYK